MLRQKLSRNMLSNSTSPVDAATLPSALPRRDPARELDGLPLGVASAADREVGAGGTEPMH